MQQTTPPSPYDQIHSARLEAHTAENHERQLTQVGRAVQSRLKAIDISNQTTDQLLSQARSKATREYATMATQSGVGRLSITDTTQRPEYVTPAASSQTVMNSELQPARTLESSAFISEPAQPVAVADQAQYAQEVFSPDITQEVAPPQSAPQYNAANVQQEELDPGQWPYNQQMIAKRLAAEKRLAEIYETHGSINQEDFGLTA